jgi:hypothetical protein
MDKMGFRQFVTEKWFEHKDEILSWTRSVPGYESDYYFHQHKWMLKKMYQEWKKEVDKGVN